MTEQTKLPTTRHIASLMLVAFVCQLATAQTIESQQQRLSTARNSASQRYEVNQTFDGQAYYKDNNVWVYDRAFADLFGMPAKYIEDLQGATAAAFRLEVAPYQQCGFGGRDEACAPVQRCYVDLYFDESKTPLPWATDVRHQWMPTYGSARWLRPLDEKEKPYGMTAPDSPPGIKRNRVSAEALVAFADPGTKWQAIFTSNVGDPRAGDEEVSGGMGALMGYSRAFYKSLSLVSLNAPCSMPQRRSINVRLDAKQDIYGPPIARFNRVVLPAGFVQRMKDVIKVHERLRAEFYRGLSRPPIATRGTAPVASQPNQ